MPATQPRADDRRSRSTAIAAATGGRPRRPRRWWARWCWARAARRRWCSRRRCSSGRPRPRIRCACPTPRCATSPSSRRTSGAWRRRVSLVGGLRGDFYDVTTEATPGYDVASVVAGAVPRHRSGDAAGSERRDLSPATPLTGDIGLVANAGGAVSPFVRFGRSYRHPNLEEMLFAGPATAGSIAPNVTVEPETGNNFDVGAKFAVGRVSGGAYALRQPVPGLHRAGSRRGDDAGRPAGAGDQLRRRADPRRRAVARRADRRRAAGVLTLTGAAAFTRGTITEGVSPLAARRSTARRPTTSRR